MEQVVRVVFQYAVAQNIPALYTWDGGITSLLLDWLRDYNNRRMEAEKAREKAELENLDYIEAFDEENNDLNKKISNLQNRIESLTAENRGLKNKFNNTDKVPILYLEKKRNSTRMRSRKWF